MVCAALKPDTKFVSVLDPGHWVHLIEEGTLWTFLQPPPTTMTLGAMTWGGGKRLRMKDQVLSWESIWIERGIKDGGGNRHKGGMIGISTIHEGAVDSKQRGWSGRCRGTARTSVS